MNLPEGWKLVPIEPVYQMAEAMGVKWEQGDGFPSRWKSALAAAPTPTSQEELTNTYVQPVPDKCDRITWRGRYYSLPTSPAQEDEPVYQVRSIGSLNWRDTLKQGYDAYGEYAGYERRILYTRPADDKLRKAAEEVAYLLSIGCPVDGKRLKGSLDNLCAVLEGKNDLP